MDPDGAYSQLIRLQKVNSECQRNSFASSGSSRLLTKRVSLERSLSRGSSGAGNSSRHSFNLSFGLPTGLDAVDKSMPEPDLELNLATEKPPKVPIHRLALLNKPELPVILIGTLAAIANGVILPMLGLIISSSIKTLYEPPEELKKDSKFWALMYAILGLASLLVIPARSYFFAVAGCKLIKRIRLMCFKKVVHMEIGWFDEAENSSGTIGARLSANAASVRALVGDTLAQVVENIASAVAGLLIAFLACWQLAFIILVLFPLIGVTGYFQLKFMKGFSSDAKVCSIIFFLIF